MRFTARSRSFIAASTSVRSTSSNRFAKWRPRPRKPSACSRKARSSSRRCGSGGRSCATIRPCSPQPKDDRDGEMKLLAIIAACGILFSTVYYLAAIIAGLIFAHRANRAPEALPKIPPRVAILKPLRGVSEHLRENIISFLEIAYARVEYIFGVTSYEDRAIDVPVSLRAPYQFANMTVTVGDEPGCTNRKIAKLIRMAERASEKTEIFVLSDADISVAPDHLKRVVSELMANEKTGLVTCLYRGQAYESFASRMEALFINTDFAPQVLLAEMLEPMHYALGATIAVKREALEAIGGFRALK